MTTVSATLSQKTIHYMDELVDDGIAKSRADVIRKAVERYVEEHAIQAVLRAEKEPTLEGDLDELVRKIR
ncbi:ribbon-helix-helix protein, CopG family [Candidatus Peregrinibacteria bacterium]|nr:ribbon-helix-helix protein, CopG family [Candidatus Peregrinibacteria bacterium]MBI3816857.1 ribbon-helix-helix protein, CopG family [Candidatus Peregrinibacteria bacterium]